MIFPFAWLDDEELELYVEQLRARAHDSGKTHNAQRGNDWITASAELDRRRKHANQQLGEKM